MASNLGTSDGNGFNFNNMKPDSGDQIDALWGQNLADNAAYCAWGKEEKAFDLNISIYDSGEYPYGTAYGFWTKVPGHKTVHGTGIMSSDQEVSGTLWLDGNFVYGDDTSSKSEQGFSFDQTNFNEGEHYKCEITARAIGAASADYISFGVSGWSGTNIVP